MIMMNRPLTEKENEVFELLKKVIDPELMINIIDLGLIYDVKLEETTNSIEVDLTLTSPGCPLGDVIIEDVEQVIRSKYENATVKINLVWEPMWSLDRLTQEGKETLGRI